MKKERLILLVCGGVFLYFSLLILANKLKMDFVLIGVLRELLTIPALLMLIVLSVLSIISLVKNGFSSKSPVLYALILNALTVLMLISFL